MRTGIVATPFCTATMMEPTTPPVKRFAERIGAVDQPSERRINKVPIPRMGGLAIFLGFVLTVLLFIASLLFLVGQSYNPFIYFRF